MSACVIRAFLVATCIPTSTLLAWHTISSLALHYCLHNTFSRYLKRARDAAVKSSRAEGRVYKAPKVPPAAVDSVLYEQTSSGDSGTSSKRSSYEASWFSAAPFLHEIGCNGNKVLSGGDVSGQHCFASAIRIVV